MTSDAPAIQLNAGRSFAQGLYQDVSQKRIPLEPRRAAQLSFSLMVAFMLAAMVYLMSLARYRSENHPPIPIEHTLSEHSWR